jgi:hypothetical protein
VHTAPLCTYIIPAAAALVNIPRAFSVTFLSEDPSTDGKLREANKKWVLLYIFQQKYLQKQQIVL